jgi:hypothetical protein
MGKMPTVPFSRFFRSADDLTSADPATRILPFEVFDNIANFLPLPDIRNFRLTCCALAAVGWSHLFRTFVVVLSANGFGKFNELRQAGDKRCHVRTLKFLIYGRLHHTEDDDDPTMGMLWPDTPVAGSVQRVEDIIHQIKTLFYAFNWRAALQDFPQLQELILTSRHQNRYPIREPPSPSHYLMPVHDERFWLVEHVCNPEVEHFLDALSARGRKIRQLRVDYVDWTLFENLDRPRPPNEHFANSLAYRPSPGPRLQNMLAALERLTTLDMCIVVCTENITPDETHQRFVRMTTSLITGGLASFLNWLPYLRHLAIGLERYTTVPLAFGIDSVHVLDPDTHWPHLQSLSLSNIALHSGHMLPFFDKHRETLDHIELENVMVVGDALSDFLHDMRKILNMTSFYPKGVLFGLLRRPIEGEPYAPWQLLYYEMFLSGRAYQIGDQLQAYILRELAYPLTFEAGHRMASFRNMEDLDWKHQEFVPN